MVIRTLRCSGPLWAALAVVGLAALAVLLGKGMVQQMVNQFSIASQPYIVNPMEGREAVKAWMLSQGQPIYPSFPDTFIITIYTLLYHFLTRAAGGFTGDFLLAARLVSLASMTAVAVLIGAWVRRTTGSRLIAWLAALSFYADGFMGWGVQARPDMLSLALALGGAYLFMVARGRGAAFWSAVLAALALLTKQQTLPFVLGTALYGLLKGREERRVLLVYLATLAMAAGLPALAVNSATNGQFFIDTLTYPARMSSAPGVFSMDFLRDRVQAFWNVASWKIVLTGCWVVFCAVRFRLDFAALLLVCNLPFVLRILGTWGADTNYALCLVVLMYICLGMLAGSLLRLPRAGLALALALLVTVNADGGLTPSRMVLTIPGKSNWTGSRERIGAFLHATPGPVLVNTEGGPVFLGHGQDAKVVFFDAIELDLFEKAGMWRFSGSPLAQAIAARRFSAIILSNDFLPQGMHWLMDVYYTRVETVGQYTLHVPRPESRVLPVASMDYPLRAGGLSLAVVERENVKVAPDHIEAEDQTRPARLTVELVSDVAGREVGLNLYPRLNHSDGSEVRVSVQSGAGEGSTWACPVQPGKTWSGVWEMRAFERFPVRGRTARISFTLVKNGQLYFSGDRPLAMFWADE